jgi:hypothetical protein
MNLTNAVLEQRVAALGIEHVGGILADIEPALAQT